MAYRYPDRKQKALFPQSIDEYISEDSPVRAYDAIIDSLDFRQLGIEVDPHKVGCPQYDPKVMLKVLVYGYSYGVRSSRKLEREICYNLSFIWLCGGLKPDHKTIAEFRKNNKAALTKILRQCARLCIELDLIEGNTLFIDGSKIRGNASIRNTWTKERCEHSLKDIDRRIEIILDECEQQDKQEENQSSLVKVKEELKDQRQLKSKIKAILEKLRQDNKSSINMTDLDCCKFHTSSASGTGYNAQSVVDGKHGLIVSSDVVNENTDHRQFATQVNKAIDTMEKKPEAACADCGYFKAEELEKIDEQGIEVVVPSQKLIENKPQGPFDKPNFKYNAKRDCYICPEGQVLEYSWTEADKGRKIYRVRRSICMQCKHFGVCTNEPIGRRLSVRLKEEAILKFEAQYKKTKCQEIYKLRKQKVELPFGHIKRNLKFDSFLLRGLVGVKAEMSLVASCLNIARMITLLGVKGLNARLAK